MSKSFKHPVQFIMYFGLSYDSILKSREMQWCIPELGYIFKNMYQKLQGSFFHIFTFYYVSNDPNFMQQIFFYISGVHKINGNRENGNFMHTTNI